MELKVSGGYKFTIQSPSVVLVENESLIIGDDPPDLWMGGTKLSKIIGIDTLIPDCIVPYSILVKSSDGSTVYEESRDYVADNTWGTIARLSGGRIKKGANVLVSYKYSLERIDLLQRSVDGIFSIKKGIEEKTCPQPSDPDKKNKPVANIFLSYHTVELADDLIYPVGSPYPEPTDSEMLEKSKYVLKTLRKLQEGKPVTVVFWGDSVTTGCDTSSLDKAFPSLFVNMLNERFTNATVKFYNAGIGGSSTNSRLPNIQNEVLKYNPDLVIIEFVNDMGIEENNFKSNYFNAIDLIRGKNSEIIIIAPHFVMPSWMNHSSVKYGKETRCAINILREIALEKRVGFADASKRWEHLVSEGIPYTTLLFNGINHPDDRGHKIFAEELVKFFPLQ